MTDHERFMQEMDIAEAGRQREAAEKLYAGMARAYGRLFKVSLATAYSAIAKARPSLAYKALRGASLPTTPALPSPCDPDIAERVRLAEMNVDAEGFDNFRNPCQV